MSERPDPFDRLALRRRRDRAAAGLAGCDFLFAEIAARLIDRLNDSARHFPLALDLGCRTGLIARDLAGEGGIERVISLDPSAAMLRQAVASGRTAGVVAEEEWLPFAPHCFDVVLSNLSLHATNDLPGALIQVRQALRPDGLFLAAMLGGETLVELRQVLMEAELAETGGVSPRVAPMVGVREAGMLMQRAGFALPVIDSDRITVSYGDLFSLMRDLRGMGESNVLADRLRRPTSRMVFARAAADYASRFTGADGRLQATFEVVFLTGWAPHASQPQPLKPGSGQVSLASVLGDR